jgi:hypothetical protein
MASVAKKGSHMDFMIITAIHFCAQAWWMGTICFVCAIRGRVAKPSLKLCFSHLLRQGDFLITTLAHSEQK